MLYYSQLNSNERDVIYMNNQPRKCLGYRTPNEAFFDELTKKWRLLLCLIFLQTLHFKLDFTIIIYQEIIKTDPQHYVLLQQFVDTILAKKII